MAACGPGDELGGAHRKAATVGRKRKGADHVGDKQREDPKNAFVRRPKKDCPKMGVYLSQNRHFTGAQRQNTVRWDTFLSSVKPFGKSVSDDLKVIDGSVHVDQMRCEPEDF